MPRSKGRVRWRGFAALLAFQVALPADVLAQTGPSVQVATFNIEPQPVYGALVDFARQAGLRLVLSAAAEDDRIANRVAGALAPADALRQLLEGTGYTARIEADAILVDVPGAGSANSGRRADASGSAAVGAGGGGETESDIVVTGSSIRGVHPASSPLDVYTDEDVARTGALTTEGFIQKLPANLASRSAFDSGATGQANREAVSAVDLRGLGLGSTLVLLNGRRLGLSASGQAADVSFVPLSAVQRVEIVADGASAIYGSDAIGGVVNFILRDDFEGAETRLSYGGVTDGGLRRGQASQTLGGAWIGGQALASLSYHGAEPLRREDRAYSAAAGPGELTPLDRRWSLLATGHQAIGPDFSIEGDLLTSTRDIKSEFAGTNFATFGEYSWSRAETDQVQVNLAGGYAFGADMRARVAATYADVDSRVVGVSFFSLLNLGPFTLTHDTSYQALDITATLDGTLFATRAGATRFAIGAGVLEEDYEANRALTGVASNRPLARRTSYVFGELNAPLIGAEADAPLIERLEVNLAARFTQYDDQSTPSAGQDFGGDISPKIGIFWSPFARLGVRASYGESFRAPALTQIDPTTSLHNIVDRMVQGAPSRLVVIEGPISDLRPELAETYTIGIDWEPSDDLRLSVTYFNIDYEGRIARPDSTGGTASFANPMLFPDVMIPQPSAATLEDALRWGFLSGTGLGYDLSDIPGTAALLAALPNIWLLDNRTRNLARSRLDGLDFSARYQIELGSGALSVGAQVTRLFDSVQRNQPSSPEITVVDTALQPVDLRARIDAAWTSGPFTSALGVNYVDDYANPFAQGGAAHIDSWTTIDLTLGYTFGASSPGIDLRLAVQNLLDEDPPFVRTSGAGGLGVRAPVGYDPANANPLGRLVSLELTKRW